MKIPPARYKLIEHELYNYDDTVERLDVLREQIINRPSIENGDRVQSNKTSNPTLTKTMELITNAEVEYMSRVVRAINTALLLLDEQHNEIFIRRYKKKENWRQTLSNMYICQNVYFKKRRELIQMVAVQMGLAKP